jgi:hypothetical protein
MPKKMKPAARSILWEFSRDVPTMEFFEGLDLDEDGGLSEGIENFIFAMEEGTFSTWEAVVSREQGLRLTRRQKEILDELVDSDDSDDSDEEEILYIDDLPRPSEPWYAILGRLAPRLLVRPFRTAEPPDSSIGEGWGRLVECLEEHAEGLSLPAGAASPLDAVPPRLQHVLALEALLAELSGLGQEGAASLEQDGEPLDWCIGSLRASKESAAFLDLTLDSLLERLVLPEGDRQNLVKRMMEILGLSSTRDRIAERL